MHKKLTKEIHYANGVKLVYNDRLKIWESRREPRTKQQFDNAPRNPQPQQAFPRIPATLSLKPLQNHCTVASNNNISVGNKNDSDSDIEVVFESAKPTSKPEPKPQPQPNLQPFRNVSANLALKQIASNVQSVNRFADDEIEVEIIRSSNRVKTIGPNGPNAQQTVSRPLLPAVKPLVNPIFSSLFDLQRKLKITNITLTQQSNRSENIVVPTQSIPVKPRISVKPLLANNLTLTGHPVTNQITLKAYQPPPIELRAPVETRKPAIKYEKCTEATLVCVVCRCVFLNPGDSELDSRLFGRFCCRKCNQFLNDCCSGILDFEKFQCCNDGICDIGGDERCHFCWFDRAFTALNVDETQKLTAKESNSEERKRKYVYESDSSYNSDRKSEIGSHCKFCGKYISSDYNMRVHWVHVHTEEIRDVQLPPSLEKIRQQKYDNRRFKRAMSDDEY